MVTELGELSCTQFLKRAVDMHRRQASDIGKFLLCDRPSEGPLIPTIPHKTQALQTDAHLTDQVRQTLVRRPPPHIDDPLATDSCVQERVAPKRESDARILR